MSKVKSKEAIIEDYLQKERLAQNLPPQANYLLALYYHSKDEYGKSLEEILKAIEKEDQRWDLYQHLAYLGKKAQDLKIAYQRIKSSLEKHKDSHNLILCLGLCYLLEGKTSEAIEEFQKAVSLNSDFGLAYFFLGMAYLECICSSDVGKEKDSLLTSLVHQEFSKAKENKVIQSSSFKKGTGFLKQDKYQKALKEFKQTLEEVLSADFVFGTFEQITLYHFIAPELVDYEMTQKAIRELDQRIEKQNYLQAYNRLGVAYLVFLRLLLKEAENCFVQAKTLAPKFQKPSRNLKFLQQEEKEFSNLFEFLRF